MSKTWSDPIAFHVRNNDWKNTESYNSDRNKIKLCKRVRDGQIVNLKDLQKALKAVCTPEKAKIGARVGLTVKEGKAWKEYPAQIVDYVPRREVNIDKDEGEVLRRSMCARDRAGGRDGEEGRRRQRWRVG